MTEHDNLRAEVERLTREKAEDQRIIGGWSEQNQRLREALRSYGSHTPDCGDARGCTCGFSAVLAGSPVETRLPVDDEAEARFEKLLAKRREKAEAWLNQGPEVSGTLAFHAEPVERKPMFGGFAGVETGALVVPSDERRALEERAAHLATRQELSMALAQRHVLVEAAVRATIEACKQEVFELPTYQVGDDEAKYVMFALADIDPAPIVARVLGGGE